MREHLRPHCAAGAGARPALHVVVRMAAAFVERGGEAEVGRFEVAAVDRVAETSTQRYPAIDAGWLKQLYPRRHVHGEGGVPVERPADLRWMCRVACVVRRSVQAHAVGRMERVAVQVRLPAAPADVLVTRVNFTVLL